MIPGQAESFYDQLRHRYRELPEFHDIYNQALEVVKEAEVKVTINNLDLVISRFLRDRDSEGEYEVYDFPGRLFIVETEGEEPTMMSRFKVDLRWPFMREFLEIRKLEMVHFVIGGKEVRVKLYKE